MLRKTRTIRIIAPGFLALALLLLAAGCAVTPTPQQNPASPAQVSQPAPGESAPAAAATPALPAPGISCTSTQTPQQLAKFPTATAGDITNGTPTMTPEIIILATRLTAMRVGKLDEVDGCLRIGDLTIAWPPEFVVTKDGDILRVVGLWGKGETWEFRMGQIITIGGGNRRDLTEEKREQLRVPAGCAGPYWVFGGGTEENLIQPAK